MSIELSSIASMKNVSLHVSELCALKFKLWASLDCTYDCAVCFVVHVANRQWGNAFSLWIICVINEYVSCYIRYELMSNKYLGNLWTFFLRANFNMNVYMGCKNLTAIILQVADFPERDPIMCSIYLCSFCSTLVSWLWFNLPASVSLKSTYLQCWIYMNWKHKKWMHCNGRMYRKKTTNRAHLSLNLE